ncbi:nitrate reductase [Allopusillimonas soli]|uniref:Molybdopterin-dependent oxidoreductase n=1 Tax=Allopusillimonas soli TaxID=659016 RepID=A0A853FD54_9BURK|nr:nitrate reductase [Allopusillimonas soli]NYT37839.1 molybdopterin-dependent oxidoreductase [Allopusillimonas soli]TEA73744.1 nitrate reductase [Allopusillimonas soli]
MSRANPGPRAPSRAARNALPPEYISAAGDDARVTRSICCYCGTGCGVRIHSSAGRVLTVDADPLHPSNQGLLCSKGRALAGTVHHDGSRVLSAQWRGSRSERRRDIALDEAYDIAARELARIIETHGPNAVAFYVSGQLLTEDYAVFNKMARALVGTNNIDTNSRLCMSSAVTGYKLTLGADAPPACYDDLALADTVLIAGANPAFAHPVLYQRLAAAKAARPDMKVIVVDPRRTDTCALADLHLPILAGSDVALFHAMLNIMVWDGLVDDDYIARHTAGFAPLKQRIHEFTPGAAENICGVPAQDIVKAAHWFGRAGSALSLYAMGLNQSSSGTAKNTALIHLHLATGQIGRPGTGPFSLTGQPNAMGGREAGAMATLLPGHRDPGNAAHRHEVARLWGVDSLPELPGRTALDIFEGLRQGRVKAVWIAATNPAQSLPDQARVRAALSRAELVIVQEAFSHAETLAYADLVLPAATWPEKSGTVTNSERRISRVRAAITPPGDARPDWQLACAVARRLARRIAPWKAALFDYDGEAAIFAEHARMTAGQDLDYSALTHEILDRDGPLQWPYKPGKAPDPAASARLYQDGVFPTGDGRARFHDGGYAPVAEPVSAQYPLRLTSGRMRDQWHSMTRSSLETALTRHAEEPRIYLHPSDMRRGRVSDDDLVRVRTRRGVLVLPARQDDALRPGHTFLPMHWGSAFMAGDGINALTSSARDPLSHQPELKHSAASVQAAPFAWSAQAWLHGPAPALRLRLMPWLRRFPFAMLLPSAMGGESVRLRMAGDTPPAADTLHELACALELREADLSFDDPARGIVRRIRRQGSALHAWLLAGDVRAAPALLQWADSGEAPASPGQILMGRASAAPRPAIVCTCGNVSDAAIRQALDEGMDVEQVKTTLQCGVFCGACVPQIQRMAAEPRARPLTA